MNQMERNAIFHEFPSRVSVMGIPVDPWTMNQTVKATELIIDSGLFAHLIGVNADKYLQMKDDSWVGDCIRGCEIVNADGASMVMAAKRLGVFLPERVAGIDLMMRLCSLAEQRKVPIYLLGAKEEVVHQTADNLKFSFPDLLVSGIRNGYFSDDNWDVVAEEIKNSGAAITFVGITSPKKERLIEYFRKTGLAGVFVGVGGSFDVISGNIPRAPKWMQQMKLEWVFRMLQEPRRLIKRYAIGNTRFMIDLLRWQRGDKEPV